MKHPLHKLILQCCRRGRNDRCMALRQCPRQTIFRPSEHVLQPPARLSLTVQPCHVLILLTTFVSTLNTIWFRASGYSGTSQGAPPRVPLSRQSSLRVGCETPRQQHQHSITPLVHPRPSRVTAYLPRMASRRVMVRERKITNGPHYLSHGWKR